MLTMTSEGLEVSTPYDRGLVAALKAAIPYPDRRWKPDKKVWVISPKYGAVMAQLIEAHIGIVVTPPQQAVKPQQETRLIELEYLGRCKDRGGDEASAFGYADGDWSVIIPEKVLKYWFCAIDSPSDRPTLYGVLGVPRSAESIEIKNAFRRLAKQWHPDVCDDPDAHDQFITIGEAYEVLSDGRKRARYDAGLALEATLKKDQRPQGATLGYRAPLKCGWVLVEGHQMVGRFVVSRILQWEDIKDKWGRVLVTNWPPGGNHFKKIWR
jgi:hypothetical protein